MSNESQSDTPRTDSAAAESNTAHIMGIMARTLERELNAAQARIVEFELQCEKLREELEVNTRETDSYGVEGSDFFICSYCQSESGAGWLNKGIPHETSCILYKEPKP